EGEGRTMGAEGGGGGCVTGTSFHAMERKEMTWSDDCSQGTNAAYLQRPPRRRWPFRRDRRARHAAPTRPAQRRFPRPVAFRDRAEDRDEVRSTASDAPPLPKRARQAHARVRPRAALPKERPRPRI